MGGAHCAAQITGKKRERTGLVIPYIDLRSRPTLEKRKKTPKKSLAVSWVEWTGGRIKDPCRLRK